MANPLFGNGDNTPTNSYFMPSPAYAYIRYLDGQCRPITKEEYNKLMKIVLPFGASLFKVAPEH